jgi:hypothetical protein
MKREGEMKLAKILFWVAGIWGVLILTPLYFMFDLIGRQDPPPITHPAFYYGFVGAGLAFQLVFFVIGSDPVRFRPMMIPAVLEKFSYGTALIVLFWQHRLHPADFAFGAIDLLYGLLFLLVFFKLPTTMIRQVSTKN